MMYLCGQMSTNVSPTPARMVARAQTLSTATRVNAQLGSLEVRVRSVRMAYKYTVTVYSITHLFNMYPDIARE